jgi:hypothetical protein
MRIIPDWTESDVLLVMFPVWACQWAGGRRSLIPDCTLGWTCKFDTSQNSVSCIVLYSALSNLWHNSGLYSTSTHSSCSPLVAWISPSYDSCRTLVIYRLYTACRCLSLGMVCRLGPHAREIINSETFHVTPGLPKF